MELAMCAEIYFKSKKGAEFSITRISAVTIESSWKMLTDTAEIILPRNVYDFDAHKVRDIFATGDKVTITLGYDGNLKKEFEGYISQVSADFPIKIKCEDEMYRLRRIPVNFSHPNIKLKEFIEKVVTDYPIDIDADILLGAVRFSKTNLGAVLDELQKEWSLYSFIRNGKLTIAKPYSDVKIDPDAKSYQFDLERNCVSNNLNYLSKEDRLVKVIGQSIKNVAKAVKAKSKDKKLKFEFGDDDAKTTINWDCQVNTLAELEREVKRIYAQTKKDGFDGTFLSFGIPSIVHGEALKITSALYPDREGKYYVDRIKKTFSRQGYRQEIELGQKAV